MENAFTVNVLNSIFQTNTVNGVQETVLDLPHMLIAMGASVIMGVILSLVYMRTRRDRSATQSFLTTLVILPLVIAIIIMLIGNSVARAFSLAGAFAIIRFRSQPGDPKDITYVLCSMALGLACGMGYVTYGLVMTVAIAAVLLVLDALRFGGARQVKKTLRILVPEDLDYQGAFDEVLYMYTSSYSLTRIKTVDLGSLYELTYSVVTRPEANDKQFVDALRVRNGNLTITLVLEPPPAAEF
jgi:uncharacterized membrane protein YhiD involved in acid resistance